MHHLTDHLFPISPDKSKSTSFPHTTMPVSTPRSPKNTLGLESGIFGYLPSSWAPYAELMRLHKPVGIMNIFFPYLFGSLFVACISNPPMETTFLLGRIAALFSAAFVLRSGGCTWNDIVDRDIDRLVERTRSRPMARGALSLRAAYVFTAAQAAIWCTLLVYFLPDRGLLYAVPLLFLVWLYPFAKRFTDYAQVVLGFTLSWGVLIGAAAMNFDPLVMDGNAEGNQKALAGLYLVYVVWTVIHDTVYAHQDVRDDLKAGIRSMAVRWLHYTKTLLWVLASIQIGLLVAIGWQIEAGKWYYYGSVGANTAVLTVMILKLDLSDPQDCSWWFQVGSLLIGASISAALSGEYFARSMEQVASTQGTLALV